MPEQPQTLRECAALRQECQRELFAHIDKRHEEVIDAIGEIRTDLAYQKGVAAARNESGQHEPVRWSWQKLAGAIAIVTAAIGGAIVAVYELVRRTVH